MHVLRCFGFGQVGNESKVLGRERVRGNGIREFATCNLQSITVVENEWDTNVAGRELAYQVNFRIADSCKLRFINIQPGRRIRAFVSIIGNVVKDIDFVL